jgi:hypothetical protein
MALPLWALYWTIKFLKNKIKKKSKMRKLRKTVYASEQSQGGLLEPLVFAFIG